MSNVKKNLGLQTAYQVLSACMPLITAPYLARKLGAAQLGVFSYTTSVVLYFTLVAMLGTVNYGTRSVASAKNNRSQRSDVFSGIFALQIIVTLIATAAYAVYLSFFCSENRLIALLQGIALISCLVDVNWLFFGVEDFQITVTRSVVIKIVSVCLILLLVKREADLWIYTLIMTGSTLVSNAVLFVRLPKYVAFTRVSVETIKKHIKPNLVLFVPLLAMTVYHTMDKTMLGLLSTYEQSGFYYNSDKIVQIPLLVINGIGTVMLPRISALLANGKQSEANDQFIATLEGVAVTSIAMACGIAAVSNEFVPIFFGAGYEPCVALTIVFTPIFLFKGSSVIIRTQYLIPMKMEREFTKSVVVGAVVNLILNFILIPLYGAMGAAIATVVAEIAACAIQLRSLHGKDLDFGKTLARTCVYAIIGLLMAGIVRVVALIRVNTTVKLALEIVVGASFYGTLCVLYWRRTNNRIFETVCLPVLKKLKRA